MQLAREPLVPGVPIHQPTDELAAALFLSDANIDYFNTNDYFQSMLTKQGYVYIMSNQYRTTFYIGVTSDLTRRVSQHIVDEGLGSAFVKKYKLHDLVYYEYFENITDAINREKQLKNWHKAWKINLIQSENPEMKDLKYLLEL